MIRDLFNRQYAKKDILAGLTLAVESVPDGVAVGTLAAINPMNGVYAYMMGGLPSPKKRTLLLWRLTPMR